MGIQKERMLAGELYIADDPDLAEDYARCERILARFNATIDRARHAALLAELVDEVGEGVSVRPPFRIEYGYQTRIGPRTFVNNGAVFLDVAKITIGADVQMGPNVQLLTATHPIDPETRRARWEGGEPITIGDNVWLGGGVIVCPGVTIGENTVVGAGAVVPADLPPNVVAVGNPARVVKHV
ncbi:MAG TPA: sugar O-acetyltransferase [Actinophytocola sp.]|uniref:sugar O-acetyltransferase n=1 Tax=Actinophytocola sp. TaxID=1872138 RepID=UPI002F94183D